MVSRNVESGLKTNYECAEKQYLFYKFFYILQLLLKMVSLSDCQLLLNRKNIRVTVEHLEQNTT